MIIHRMQATFGTLAGDELKPGEGLNIIYAPNESGKSTWCAFLRAMLYGIDTAQRARGGRLPDKTKYAPWSGAPMEGLMELTHNGEAITLRRTTAQRGAPMGEFSAVYTGTNIPVPGLTAANVGETLTGVSADVFARTAFIGQGSVMLSGTPELEKRIAAIVTSGEEDCSYTEADSQLRAWLRKRRSGSRGALPELEQQISETEQRLQRLENTEQQRQVLRLELEQTDAELQTLSRSMNDARSRSRRDALRTISAEKAHLQALEQNFDAARRDAAQKRTALEQTAFGVADPDQIAERVERDAKRIGALEQLAAQKQPPYLALGALVLAALCVVLALLVTKTLYYAAAAFAVIGLCCCCAVHQRHRGRTRPSESARRSSRTTACGSWTGCLPWRTSTARPGAPAAARCAPSAAPPRPWRRRARSRPRRTNGCCRSSTLSTATARRRRRSGASRRWSRCAAICAPHSSASRARPP